MKIEVYNNDIEKAYRILQKKLNTEGILKELKEREYYLSKGERKRLEQKRGIARFKKQEKKRLIAQEKAEIRIFKRYRQLRQQNKVKHHSSPPKYNKNWKHPQK